MAQTSRAQGAYRSGGILLALGGLAALFFGLSQNQIFNMALLGLVSLIVGIIAATTGKGEGLALGLSIAGAALMVYFLIRPPPGLVVATLSPLATILRYAAPVAYSLALLLFVVGGFLDKK